MVEELAPALMNAPAAKSNHHGYLGGLLEHMLSLMGLAERIAHYPELDRDLLVAAAVLQDIGKVTELCYLNYSRASAFAVTSVGPLIFGK
jgi:3'-5' exoribonuclease